MFGFKILRKAQRLYKKRLNRGKYQKYKLFKFKKVKQN